MWRKRSQIVVVTAIFLAALGGTCELEIVVADVVNHRIQSCPAGLACTTIAGETASGGPGSSQLKKPYGIVIHDDGDYVVSDTDNHRVQKCPKAGRGACTTVAGHSGGIAGTGATELNSPDGILIHEDGDYVVTDTRNHRVQKCPKSGTGVCITVAGVTGSPGETDTRFWIPSGTVIHEDGDYVVTDTNNHRVQKCPKAGTGACTTVAGTSGSGGSSSTQLNGPSGILIHEDGDYVITDKNNHRVQKCPKAGTGACTTVAGVTALAGTEGNLFKWPYGTAMHEDGDYVVTDTNNHRVQKCPKAGVSGAMCTTIAGSGAPGSTDTTLNYPRGIAVRYCPAAPATTTTANSTTTPNATTPITTSSASIAFLGGHPVTTTSTIKPCDEKYDHREECNKVAMVARSEATNLHWLALVSSGLAML